MTTGADKSIWWRVWSETQATQLHYLNVPPPENHFPILHGDTTLQ